MYFSHFSLIIDRVKSAKNNDVMFNHPADLILQRRVFVLSAVQNFSANVKCLDVQRISAFGNASGFNHSVQKVGRLSARKSE